MMAARFDPPTERRPTFAMHRFFRNRSGAAAVEFAMISPVLVLILAATIDFGAVLYGQFRLNEAVSAGTNFAMVNGDRITGTGSEALSEHLAAILTGSQGSASVDADVIVNNGARRTFSKGSYQSGGVPAAADRCYCPVTVSGEIQWGAAVACGTACASGGQAGKFVHLTATQHYQPFFSNYGIVTEGTISANALVRAR